MTIPDILAEFQEKFFTEEAGMREVYLHLAMKRPEMLDWLSQVLEEYGKSIVVGILVEKEDNNLAERMAEMGEYQGHWKFGYNAARSKMLQNAEEKLGIKV